MQDSENTNQVLSKEQNSLLTREAKQAKMNQKINLLKEKYEKFEMGVVGADEFRDFIVNDIGVRMNDKIEKILKAPHPDGKNFTTILTSLDLLKKKETASMQDKKNPNFSTQHMRYRKVLATPQNNQEDLDPLSGLKTKAQQLLKRIITGDDFRSVLKNYGINPMIEGINKVIRDHEAGKNVKFNELVGSITQNKGTKFDPTKVNFEIKTKKFYEEATEETTPSKKKNIQTKYNAYNSNKELFDWELSTLQKIKSGELDPKAINKDDKQHQIVHASKIFDDRPLSESPRKMRNSSAFCGSGDFFTWKGNSESKINEERSDIKRRNPNQTFTPAALEEKKPAKLNKMLFTSQGNFLNGSK